MTRPAANVVRAVLVTLGLLFVLCLVSMGVMLSGRHIDRLSEYFTRMALGASFGRLLAVGLREVGVFLLLAAAVGALVTKLADFALGTTLRVAFNMSGGVGEDWRLVALSTSCVVAVTLLVSLAAMRPIWVFYRQPNSEGKARALSSRATSQRTLLFMQGAVSFALVAAVGLSVSAFLMALTGTLGFNPDGVVTARALWPRDSVSPHGAGLIMTEFVDALNSDPRVQAALVDHAPLSNVVATEPFRLEGSATQYVAEVRRVSRLYFEVMRIGLERGRYFTEREMSGPPMTAIVSRSLASRMWPHETDSIGQRIEVGNARLEVIGVASDTRESGEESVRNGNIYIPRSDVSDRMYGSPTVVVRPEAPLELSEEELSRRLQTAVGPQVSVRAWSLASRREAAAVAPRTYSRTLWTVASLALAVVAVASFGITSQAYVRQRRTLALHVALGREPRVLMRSALVHSSAMGCAGALTMACLGWLALELGLTEHVLGTRGGNGERWPEIVISATGLVLGATAVGAYWGFRGILSDDAAQILRAQQVTGDT